MTSLEHVARNCRQCERGFIRADELVCRLFDSFAKDGGLDLISAKEIVGFIPASVKLLVTRRAEEVLYPGYLRRSIIGGRTRTAEEIEAASIRITAKEKAWATALISLLR